MVDAAHPHAVALVPRAVVCGECYRTGQKLFMVFIQLFAQLLESLLPPALLALCFQLASLSILASTRLQYKLHCLPFPTRISISRVAKMQFKTLALFFATSAIPAIAQNLGNLPQCALNPALQAIGSTGCSLQDFSCICKDSKFLQTLQPQIEAACDAADLQST